MGVDYTVYIRDFDKRNFVSNYKTKFVFSKLIFNINNKATLKRDRVFGSIFTKIVVMLLKISI